METGEKGWRRDTYLSRPFYKFQLCINGNTYCTHTHKHTQIKSTVKMREKRVENKHKQINSTVFKMNNE